MVPRRRADSLNSELAAADIYSKLDQKSVPRSLIHATRHLTEHYPDYGNEQVDSMPRGVRDSASRYLA
jgi:hypothetical protein